MRFRIAYVIALLSAFTLSAQPVKSPYPLPGWETRIRDYVDSLRVIDTHEHMFPQEMLTGSNFLDFMLLFQQNGYDDLRSAGMPGDLFDTLFNEPLAPVQKWKIIEPYWKRSFNTSFSRTILYGINRLYGINSLNESTVTPLSEMIRRNYSSGWFDRILKDSCLIDYVIQDGFNIPGKDDYFRYAKRFDSFINITAKFTVDSLAINQVDPIFSLEALVNSLERAFQSEVSRGMVAVKVALAYSRPLGFENPEAEAAKKVFRLLINGNENHKISFQAAKPLQDYMFHKLLGLARKFNLPVAIHTGLHSGDGNFINYSNPALLANIFMQYPDVNFILFHGSYPYGGELATLAKNFGNVYIDMSWVYSISPSYAERYLTEWIETVPAGKITGFGGDCMVVENVYSELKVARNIISNVLCEKVRVGYLSEAEARSAARMILFENAAKLYRLY